jgi:hypothetical protein
VIFRNYSPFIALSSSIGFLSIAGFVVIIGLSIGFIWVNVIYHPVFWQHAPVIWNDNRDWNDFCLRIVNGVASRQIAQLPKDTKIALIERFFASLRDTYPRVAFYHTKHHTVRDFGWVVLVVPLSRLLADIIFKHPTGSLILYFTASAVVIWFICICAAHNQFQTTRHHMSFISAQLQSKLAREVGHAATNPFKTDFQSKQK